MIKLYGVGLSFNVSKVRYCLNYLNLKYDWVQTNPIADENRTPEYLNMAPQQNLWVVFYLIDPMELRASEENNDSDASPTGSGCGYM
ncbi:MAG: glutathione S-transferase N-terminal domain-containing protein, partial [Gammaproteobacteria bacterium]